MFLAADSRDSNMKAMLNALEDVAGKILIKVKVKAMFPRVGLQWGGDTLKAVVNASCRPYFGFLMKPPKVIGVDVQYHLSFLV